jgi:hypothetical protein
VTQAVETRRGAFDSDLSVQAASATTWRVLAPLIWTGTQGDTFTVPVGFVTDFATVPRFLRWLINTYGPFTRAAVLHDYLLSMLAAWWKARPVDWAGGGYDWIKNGPPATSREADGIFRRVMQDLDVPGPTRWIMWTAVRWASLFSPYRSYGREIHKDLPAMLGVSVLAFVPVTLGAIPVLISLGLIRIFTGATRLLRPGRSGQ